jgi:ring-1,2-phenylacetyl-CoA epoxidase subunit PaaD
MSALTHESLPSTDSVWQWLAAIPDPEVPAISIVDLGIVRGVRWDDESTTLVVTITPTYSGCPAMDMIATQIGAALRDNGVAAFRIETRLSPPWTTEWMSAQGREALRKYGIAPPRPGVPGASVITLHRAPLAQPPIACPHCASANTECISEFGSTSCKAQYRCRDCLEPFDYFKAI